MQLGTQQSRTRQSTTLSRSVRRPMFRVAAGAAAALLTLLAIAGLSNDRAGAQDPVDPLVILVSNDDGIEAGGINAVVEALRTRSDTTVIVSAPKEDQSGKGDSTTPDASAAPGTTKSGFAGTAVDGTPADSVQHALDNPGPEGVPDLVMSGSNDGQNIGFVAPISGTIGAAQTGARAGVPALAISQGFGDPPDFPASVGAAMEWLDEHEAALRDGTEPVQVWSINAPTCVEGETRGIVEVPNDLTPGTNYGKQDCTSTLENPTTDVEAFNNGFISLSKLPNAFPKTEEPEATTTVPPSSAAQAPSSAAQAPSSTAAPLPVVFTG